MKPKKFQSYDAYWLYFLTGHTKTTTRACHYAANIIGFVGIPVALLWGSPWLALAALAIMIVMPIASHPIFEKNRPAGGDQIWGVLSNFRMSWLALTGKLKPELKRAGVLQIE